MTDSQPMGPFKMYTMMIRKLPINGEDKNTGKLFRMNVFAKDEVSAKAKVWNNMNKLVKLKKSNSELVSIKEHRERSSNVKNVGIWLRYDSRCKTHNMYREYRDMTLVGAVNRCFTDMAGKHRARADTLHVLKVVEVPANKCRRSFVKQFHDSKIKYPLPHRVMSSHKNVKFSRQAPSTFILNSCAKMQMLILRNTARSMKPISSFFVSKKRNSLSFDGASNSIVPPKKINNYIVTNENYNETKSKSNNNKNGIGFKEFDVKGTEGMSCEWKQVLSNEFSKPYFQKVAEFVANERNTKTIYPPLDMVHSWSNYCKIDDIKVVIIGQDPYHGVGQAHGLSFSVNPNIKIPASLKNIYKELKVDIENFAIPDHGFLGGWAQQGVLMLNSCLTVEKSKPNSHQKRGWEHLTDAIIQHINKNMDRVVFLLWGSNAKEKGSKIDKLRHLVLTSPHPSPFSADKGFFGCKHFSSANNYLSSNGKPMIDWCQLPKSLK